MSLTDTAAAPPAARRFGFSAEQLAAWPTVYRADLLLGQGFVVSGGGSGIGRATAFLLTRLGADVLICGRDEAKLKGVTADIERLLGRRPHALPLNIREPEAVQHAMAEAFARLGRASPLRRTGDASTSAATAASSSPASCCTWTAGCRCGATAFRWACPST